MSLGDMCRHHLIVDEGRRLRPKRKTYTAMPMAVHARHTSLASAELVIHAARSLRSEIHFIMSKHCRHTRVHRS